MDAVLIADDDALVRTVLRAALERRGLPVVEAGDGDALLGRLAEREFGLCIMDARMPGAGLEDRLEHLREVVPGLPVVVLTGGPDESGMADAGVRFLRKPIDLADLDAVLLDAAGAGR